MKYGRLEVLDLAYIKNSQKYYNCVCVCGNKTIVYISNLKNGHTKSCGCLHDEKFVNPKTHGMSNTRIYNIWAGMIQRCNNFNVEDYSKYGGAGITVCERWLKFENFYEDMGDDNDLTLDRIDNTKGYYKENCRWATYSQQNYNRRNYVLR